MEQKEYYCIGEVSSICNISIRTLRYYDEIELIVPEIRKEDSKYRYYSKEQMVTIIIVRKLRLMGFGLKEIKQIVTHNEVDMLKECIEERLTKINQEIVELQNRAEEGEDFLRRLNSGREVLNLYDEDEAFEAGSFDEIRIENVPQIEIYYDRREMRAYKNEEVSLERWVGINEEVSKRGLKAIGPIIVTFHTELLDQFMSKDCDIEFGIQGAGGDSEKVREFGGFKAVTIYHVGAYKDIIKTYIKALQWINENGYKVTGPVSEQFIISPVDVTKESEHVTKVLFPIEQK